MPKPTSPSGRDPRLRLALALERFYATASADRPNPLLLAVDDLSVRIQRLGHLRRLHRIASERQWHVAAAHLLRQQASSLRELTYRLSGIDYNLPPAAMAVSAASIYRDLLALDQEFEDAVVADDLSCLSVVTEPIELEGVFLGRFRLELDLSRLQRGRFDGGVLRAVALDPNPAASKDDVTHPHVQSESVCLGDGSPAVTAALQEGRLCDAFVVVDRVLKTYNEGSPYVRLDAWSGRSCDACDELASEDDLASCSRCGNSLCRECDCSCCDCEETYCRSCLSEDGDDLLCSSCLQDREDRREAEQEDDEPDDPLPNEESFHEQAITATEHNALP